MLYAMNRNSSTLVTSDLHLFTLYVVVRTGWVKYVMQDTKLLKMFWIFCWGLTRTVEKTMNQMIWMTRTMNVAEVKAVETVVIKFFSAGTRKGNALIRDGSRVVKRELTFFSNKNCYKNWTVNLVQIKKPNCEALIHLPLSTECVDKYTTKSVMHTQRHTRPKVWAAGHHCPLACTKL